MWFTIKMNHKVTDAPRNLWLTTVKMRYLSDALKNIVHPVLQNNAHWAHPENLLVAMLADDRPEIREQAIETILKARATVATTNSRTRARRKVRKRELPTLTFDSDDYSRLIDWNVVKVTEPSITQHLSDAELRRILDGDTTILKPLQEFFDMVCHSQAVERTIRDVSESCTQVFGSTARDGFIRARIAHRAIMPKFETKSEFKDT